MDKKGKKTLKIPRNHQKKTTGKWFIKKFGGGSVVAENSPTPVGNSSSSNIRIQETKKRKRPDPVPLRIQYSIKKSFKTSCGVASEASKPEASKLKVSKPEA